MKHIKIILFFCFVFMTSCRKTTPIVTEQPTNVEFFSLSENKVKNGDVINVNIKTGGVYTLTMIDTIQNQIISRERFTGKVGLNSLKIFTNTLPTKYLSVVLKDQNNNEIGKTRIIIN